MPTPSLSLWYAHRHAKKPGEDASSEVARLNLVQFPAPFIEQYTSDAHFWPYVIYIDGKVSEVQISVPVKSKAPRGIVGSEAVMLSYLVLEWDAPGHQDLDDNGRAAFLENLGRLDPTEVAAQFAVFYWTRGGARLVYRLAAPLDWSRYSEKVRGLLTEIHKATGLEFDPTSDQWWRCFRLPSVVRDDGKDAGRTWEKPWFLLNIDQETVIDADDVPSRRERVSWDRHTGAAIAPEQCPEKDKVQGLVSENFKREAKRLLRNAGCFQCVFEGLDVPPGARDAACVQFSGQVVAHLFGKINYLTAEHVYGLLLPAFDGISTEGEPLFKKLWRMVQHSWNGEVQKTVEHDDQAIEASSTHEKFLDEVLANYDERLLPDSPDDRRMFAMKHLILVKGMSHYVVSTSGRYGMSAVRAAQVPAVLRDSMPWFRGFWSDKMVFKAMSSILADYSSNLDRLIIVAARERGLRVIENNRQSVLELTPYALREDVCAYAADDDQIAAYFATWGDRGFPLMHKWYCCAPAVWEGGIAALSLKGPKRTGKSMVAAAFSEMFGAPPTPAAIAFGHFNGPLAYSPVIIAEEGLPRKIEGTGVADMFRAMVVGSGVAIEAKGLEPIYSNVCYRFIFCSNNNDMLMTLAGGKILNRDDTNAIGERIVHIQLDTKPSDYLTVNGDMAFTRYHHRGPWIGGDPSRGGMRMARYFAYHFLQAQADTGSVRFHQRLLVEGDLEPQVVAMLENAGCTPDVAGAVTEDVGKIIAGKANNILNDCLKIYDGRVFYRKRYYVHRIVEMLGKNARNGASEIRKILDRWSTGEERKIENTMWWGLKIDEIITVAKLEGLDYAPLVELQSGVRKI